MELNLTQPGINESPLNYAVSLSRLAASGKHPHERQKLGQYFTSKDTAKFISSFSAYTSGTEQVRILDPGTGTGVLSCALVESIINKNPSVSIHLVCYEVDKSIFPYTRLSLEYLKEWAASKKAVLSYSLLETDFILANQNLFQPEYVCSENFDIVISNPPFFKLSTNDERNVISENIIFGQKNIYSLFIIAAVKLLKYGGELLFLVPRSFCSGSYFGEFRELLNKHLMYEHIHLFTSGLKIFGSDGVVNDSIMVKARKMDIIENEYCFLISSSVNTGLKPGNLYNYTFNKEKNIIPLPASGNDIKILETVSSWPESLANLGYLVSCGNVLKSDIENFTAEKNSPDSDKTPVITLEELNCFVLKDLNQEIAFLHFIKKCYETERFFIKNKNYIFLRRYNKMGRERKISAISYINSFEQFFSVCVDKQLLYIHKQSGEFEIAELLGLTSILNSEVMNSYLKIVYGNINLSIAELLNMPLPSLEIIIETGQKIS